MTAGASEEPLRIFEIFRTLREHAVEFIVIGGIAVAVHGFERATKDLDIVPRHDLANLERLFAALSALEARPLELQDFRAEELPVSFTVEGLAAGGNWFLTTRHGRIDVMQFIETILERPEDYDRLESNAISVPTPAGDVRFVGYDDLIDLKYAAGRDQDLVDIRALREANDDTAP